MRLDKFICECSGLSRKEAASYAKRGLVTLNDLPVRDLSVHVDEYSAKVRLAGEELVYEKYVYVMLNKPDGYVSATEDTRFPVVTELLSEKLQKKELFPVGRLDKDTLGLMILTNNGKLAHALLSPKRHCEKKYFFRAAEPLAMGAEEMFEKGIILSDGYECKSAVLSLDVDRQSGVITLTEGKYHQIKRMLGALGNKITYLERISFAGILLDSSLARGEYRPLSEGELALLEKYN